MTDQGSVPPDFWQQIDRRIDQKVAAASRAASIRNASISSGGTFSITGGALVFKADDGTTLFYLGPVLPRQLDGSAQPGWIVQRADGTTALTMYDAVPGVGGVLNQALNWFDRQGNVVLADDTNSGQGLARPYIPGVFYRSDYADWVTTTSTTFQTKFQAAMPKQQPRLYVRARASNDTSGATGEMRVLVNGVAFGNTVSTSFAITEYDFGGPQVVAGGQMSTLVVELQARLASGTGGVRFYPSRLEGMQS